jgi:hypothetical protein
LLFYFFTQAFAQKDFRPGYIIRSGDTLQGYVDYRGAVRNSKITTFKTDLQAPEQEFAPSQIPGYGFTNEQKVYETQTVPATETQPVQQLFLQNLIKGKASLYTYRDAADYDRFYLSKDQGALVELVQHTYNRKDEKTGKTFKMVDQAYIGTLASAFSDCPEFKKERLKNTALRDRSLVQAIKEYNQCMASDIAHQQTEPKTKVTRTPVLIYSINSLQASGDHPYTRGTYSNTGLGIGGGIAFNFSNPRLSEKLSLQAELLYAPYRFEGDMDEVTRMGRTTKEMLLFNLDYLKLPVQLRYTFPTGKVRPYLNGGFSFSYAMQVTQTKTTNSTFYSSGYVEESDAFSDGGFKRYMYGLLGGAGLSYPINDKALLLETRYEVTDGFSTINSLSTRIRSLSLLLGYTF